jgi:hypothetical protein
MTGKEEKLVYLACGLAGILAAVLLSAHLDSRVRNAALDTCRKAHDVYACQLVAVPVPALPAATNT